MGRTYRENQRLREHSKGSSASHARAKATQMWVVLLHPLPIEVAQPWTKQRIEMEIRTSMVAVKFRYSSPNGKDPVSSTTNYNSRIAKTATERRIRARI